RNVGAQHQARVRPRLVEDAEGVVVGGGRVAEVVARGDRADPPPAESIAVVRRAIRDVETRLRVGRHRAGPRAWRARAGRVTQLAGGAVAGLARRRDVGAGAVGVTAVERATVGDARARGGETRVPRSGGLLAGLSAHV